jgi:hypothetical protein
MSGLNNSLGGPRWGWSRRIARFVWVILFYRVEIVGSSELLFGTLDLTDDPLHQVPAFL